VERKGTRKCFSNRKAPVDATLCKTCPDMIEPLQYATPRPPTTGNAAWRRPIVLRYVTGNAPCQEVVIVGRLADTTQGYAAAGQTSVASSGPST